MTPTKTLFKRFFAFSLGILFLFSSLPFSFADLESAEQKKQEQLKKIEMEYEEYIKNIEAQYQGEMNTEANRLNNIDEQIEDSLIQFSTAKEEGEKNMKAIVEKAKYATSLEENIKIFDEEITHLTQKITALEIQVKQKEIKIANLAKEKISLNTELDAQKEVVFDLMRTLQMKDPEFTNPKELRSALNFLFTDASASENIRDKRALLAVAKKSREIFYELDSATTKVTDANLTLQRENDSLTGLKDELESEKIQLETQKEGKERLLTQTRNSEQEYQKLWAVSDEQMQEAVRAVKSLKEESLDIQEKLQELEARKNFDSNIISKDRIKEVVEKEGYVSIEELGARFLKEDSEAIFSWPVEPTLGISAYFQDKSYEKIFGKPHNAIDIPVLQGTEITAPASAYVYQTKDNGYGYSYIILLHRNNMRTVYGHVSEILVKEGDIVREGQVIGKSGGIPGTKGAGTMTTGAHLHFEVLKGDEYQNPLEYLALSILEKYESLEESTSQEDSPETASPKEEGDIPDDL